MTLQTAQMCQDEDAARRARIRIARAASARAASDEADRQALLAVAVEDSVIPRLVAHLRAPATQQPARKRRAALVAGSMLVESPVVGSAVVGSAFVQPQQVQRLAQIVLYQDGEAAIAYVAGLHAGGIPAQAIYLDLLAPAALVLGRMWEDDLCDFAEVSIGLWKLQSAMRDMRDAFLINVAAPTGPRIMLVPLPGEQHNFGLSMVYDFFVRAGWDAWTGPVRSSQELRGMVATQHIDVLGFSLACDSQIDTARIEIAAARRASRNPDMAVMAGGPSFVLNPALAFDIGADGTALDGLQAVTEAMRLYRRAVAA